MAARTLAERATAGQGPDRAACAQFSRGLIPRQNVPVRTFRDLLAGRAEIGVDRAVERRAERPEGPRRA
jgi:hypothetical protein